MYDPKNNTLLTAMLSLVNTIPELPTKKTFVHRQKDSGRKKTKKGATHVIGEHFKPKYLIFMEGKPVTPAMYRRLHLGVQNPRKKNGLKSSQ